jgi:hypothetical protein
MVSVSVRVLQNPSLAVVTLNPEPEWIKRQKNLTVTSDLGYLSLQWSIYLPYAQ